jgi:hypothetical protein
VQHFIPVWYLLKLKETSPNFQRPIRVRYMQLIQILLPIQNPETQPLNTFKKYPQHQAI